MTITHFQRGQLAALVACAWPALALADHAPQKLDTVIISGGRPTTLPTQIPTTIEGISGAQVQDGSTPPTAKTR
jgi:iron complex outermembrane receptor protein